MYDLFCAALFSASGLFAIHVIATELRRAF